MWQSKWVVLDKRSQVSLTFGTYIKLYLIRFNISCNCNHFRLNSYRKMNFSRFFPNKCTMNQIWPCHKVGKGQPRFIICANLVGPTSPMLHTKSPAHWFFWFHKIFKGFYHIWTWWPSWSCDQYNWYIFWLTYHKESSYEIWVQMVYGFWENHVLMCWWDSNMSDLGWKVNGQPWPLKLIYSHCLIWLNISSENYDLSLSSFQKMKFKKTHLNALGSKFDLDVKKVKVNLGSSFEQTWLALHPKRYITSPKVIDLLVLE